MLNEQTRAPTAAPGYAIERIVEGSGFHTANGVAFGPDGRLYAASVLGESIFALDIATGAIETVVGPFAGESDDLVFTQAGDLIWTALLEGTVRMRTADGHMLDLATGLPGANSIALTRDGKRLFVGQVFMGEGVWEIDLAGSMPPRLVAEHTGGLNAFQFGADGMIYAPSWERGQVVRVNPENGHTTILADGFSKPGAVRFDSAEQLYVLDDATGELFALDEQKPLWARRLIARLATGTDNFAVGPSGLLYVSSMVDNSIHEVDPSSGAVRPVVAGGLGFPRAMALSSGPEGERLHLADSCAYRVVDPRTGAVCDIARAVATPLKFPTSVSVGPHHVVLTGEAFGVVQLFDRAGSFVREVGGFDQPSAAIELGDGSLIVAESVAGRIVRAFGDDRHDVAVGLRCPAALADAGGDMVYVAESGTGRLLRIAISDGTVSEIARGMGAIRALAVAPGGAVAVLDVEAGSVALVHPGGSRTEIVRGLPVGYLRAPYPRSGGIAVGADGTVYVAADLENAVYRITSAAPSQENGQ
jgi:sugar lactone lactonase YvrE